MKQKVLIVLLALAVMLVAGYGISQAAVTGTCSQCHTMHDSENNQDVGATGTQDHLLTNTCIGCHTDGTIGNPVGSVDVDAASGSRPAGGSFDITRAPGTQHNPREFAWGANDEAIAPTGLRNDTPGDATAGVGPAGADQLTCAGAMGCHGLHDSGMTSFQGIQGFHHASIPEASGYRFLTINPDGAVANNTAVTGIGAANRELSGALQANHNVYSSAAGTGISSLCGMCHGNFHVTTNPGVWQRHPTDFLLATNLTVASIPTDYDNTPFGWTDTTGMDTTAAYLATDAGATVVCVSCHRAHGSDQPNILRFDYATMNAGTNGNQGGCENCHVSQR